MSCSVFIFVCIFTVSAWCAVGLNVCLMVQFQYGVLLMYVYFYSFGMSCCRFICAYPYSFSMVCCWFMFYSAVLAWRAVVFYLCLCQ
jgi:hypothetical protein